MKNQILKMVAPYLAAMKINTGHDNLYDAIHSPFHIITKQPTIEDKNRGRIGLIKVRMRHRKGSKGYELLTKAIEAE